MKYRTAIIAMAMLFSLQTVAPAWAAEVQTESTASQTTEETTTETALPENALTFEEALQKALKKSASLRSAEDTEEYLDELDEYWDKKGYKLTTPSYTKWVNDAMYSAVFNMQSVESSKKVNRYNEEITKITIEATIKDYFASTLSNETALELAKDKMEIQKTLYTQGQMKYQYGIISQYDLQKLKTNYETAQDTVKSLEKTMAEQKRSFYQMIGEKEEKNYTLVYDVEYEPYEMTQTMEQYINERMKKDYTILQQELELENATFSKNYRPESISYTEGKTRVYNYDEAKRSLKTAKEDKELAIKNAYDAIIKLEDSYASAKTTLENAEFDWKVAEKNFEIGKITEVELKQKETAVEEAKSSLQQIVYNHDMQIYYFEHTELLK